MDAELFREKCVLSVLSRKDLSIDRALAAAEARFLKLLKLLCPTSQLDTAQTKTRLRPGTVKGGTYSFDCGTDRGIGYFAEYLPALCFFADTKTTLTLSGITNSNDAVSVDAIRILHRKMAALFSAECSVALTVKKRGFGPDGGGQVVASYSPALYLSFSNVALTQKILKIRGIAATARVSSQLCKRIIEGANSVLAEFSHDIHIYTDVFRGDDAGNSPGYSLFLATEGTDRGLCFVDGVGLPGSSPEETGKKLAEKLLHEIYYSGSFGRALSGLLCILAAVTTDCVCEFSFNKMLGSHKELLKEIELFLGVAFELQRKQKKLLCVGCSLRNHSIMAT